MSREARGGKRSSADHRHSLSSFRILSALCFGLALFSCGVVIAHWAAQASAVMETTTGTVAVGLTGDLNFDFPGCSPGAESRTCDKFDNEVIGTAPLSHATDGATFTITGWVYKGGDVAEPVGFYYTVADGTVEIDVKSGQNHDLAALDEGSGYWLNPACTGDPGPGGAVTCTPKNTKAISHIDFCLVISTPPICPLPQVQAATASNTGSIPFKLRISLIGPAATGADYCGVFDLTIHHLIGGSAVEPSVFAGPLCDLIGTPTLLADQVDPGDSAEYELILAFSGPTAAFNGTSGSFSANFEAAQWNASGGWTDVVEPPVMISIGATPSTSVSVDGIPPSTPATIGGETVSAVVNGPLPAVIDVLGGSTVTITSWAVDPVDPSAVLGFYFTVAGNPVYVEVQHGVNGWVDERWQEENPHIWHDPYGVGSEEATPITSIEFGLVPLADEPPAEEPTVDASLSGIVWLDEDGDGVRGATEVGVAGVVVRLLAADVEVTSTITATDGSYTFSGLDPGDYTVEIEAPTGHNFAAAGQGGDPTLDSDVTVVDPPLGRVTVSLASGSSKGVADAGLLALPAESGGG
jgi:hypothetical protein